MTRDAQTTSRQGRLTLKISKIRGGIKFYIQTFSRRNFQGGVNFCRFLPWSPLWYFSRQNFPEGLHPTNTPSGQHWLWLNTYIKLVLQTIRCQCESIFTVRELREFCGNAFSLRESRPALKIFNPTPSRSRGTPFWGSNH
jgi:hypothetical protein